jgi:hypothetical protein
MFCTNVQFVSTEPKEEKIDTSFIPIAKTKAEAKENNKYVFLPGERLSIAMAKQAIKDKKKNKKKKIVAQLSDHDLNNISSSVTRITGLLSE